MTTPLTDVLPTKVRGYVYLGYAVAVVVTGVLAAVGVDLGVVPQALLALGGALGLVAHSNPTTRP